MGGEEYEVRYRHTRDGLAADGVRVVHADARLVVLDIDGVRRKFPVARYGDQVHVGTTRLTALPRFPDPVARLAPAPWWPRCRARLSGSPRVWRKGQRFGPARDSYGWRR